MPKISSKPFIPPTKNMSARTDGWMGVLQFILADIVWRSMDEGCTLQSSLTLLLIESHLPSKNIQCSSHKCQMPSSCAKTNIEWGRIWFWIHLSVGCCGTGEGHADIFGMACLCCEANCDGWGWLLRHHLLSTKRLIDWCCRSWATKVRFTVSLQ